MTVPPTGRSWRIHALGPPGDALRLEARPVRRPEHDEACVRVEAVGLNHPDLLLCAGGYQERPGLPFSPGYEAAGTVVDAGPDAGVRAGDRAIVVPELPEGAMQDYLTVPATQLYPVPDDLPAATAAVLHIAYATAHAALHHRAHLRSGETLLVTGAAGGVGSAAVQLGKAARAYVIAVATGADKADACRSFGADAVINVATESDLPAKIRTLTGGHGADVVLDVVGGESFDRVRRSVAFEGRLVVVGFTGGTIPQAPVNHVLLRNYAVLGLHVAAYRRENPGLLRDIHAEIVRLATAGTIAPRVHTVPFADAPAGLEMFADRSAIGRIVLQP